MTHPTTTTARILTLVQQIQQGCSELEALCGRSCKLAGEAIGTVGEVIAANEYGLTLLTPSNKGFDATTSDGELVQVLTTGGNNYVRMTPGDGLLLVLRLDGSSVEQVYGGPSLHAWRYCIERRRARVSGPRTLTLKQLRRLQANLPQGVRMLPVRADSPLVVPD